MCVCVCALAHICVGGIYIASSHSVLVHNTMNIIREEPHFSLSLEMSRNVIRPIIIVHGKTWLCVYVSVCAHVYVFM